jgi:hypothetical protein
VVFKCYVTLKQGETINDILKIAGNDRCADCNEKFPKWASLNLVEAIK